LVVEQAPQVNLKITGMPPVILILEKNDKIQPENDQTAPAPSSGIQRRCLPFGRFLP
jgi:hypothetical protein